MFGMGGSEIILILIVALLFLGPDKLPEAAKSISKGIRDLKKQSRSLQQQIENDDQIGGALRDIKSALRGDEAPRPRPQRPKELPKPATPALPEATVDASADATAAAAGAIAASDDASGAAAAAGDVVPDSADTAAELATDAAATPAVRLPPTAGEPDPSVEDDAAGDDDLGSLIRPAEGAIAKGSEPKHG